MVGQILAELTALTELASKIIDGEAIEVHESLEEEDYTASIMYHKCKEYMFLVESKDTLTLSLRSIEIPELFIALPGPVFVKLGEPFSLEELC